MNETGTPLAVFSIKPTRGGSIWVRAGEAHFNGDGSLSVRLDVLPLDGKLHIRESAVRQPQVALPH